MNYDRQDDYNRGYWAGYDAGAIAYARDVSSMMRERDSAQKRLDEVAQENVALKLRLCAAENALDTIANALNER